jgi:single-strand DNA-binding protein
MAKMNNLNKCMFDGNLGRDAQIFPYDDGNKKMAALSIATNDSIGDKEYTNWHRVIVFGKIVDAIEKLYKKGKHVLVEGARHQVREYTDSEGVKKFTSEFVINGFGSSIRLMGGAPTAAAAGDAAVPEALTPEVLPDDEKPPF